MRQEYDNSQEINLERSRLLQDENLEQILRNPGKLDLITVYQRGENGDGMFSLDRLIFPALFEFDDVDRLLSNESVDDYEADAVINNRPNIWKHCYDRIERIVLPQTSGCIKVSEKIIDFHKLRHNSDASEYFKVDNEGNKKTIIRIRSDRVLIRKAELQDFLAAEEMCLSLLFEFNEHSDRSVAELGLNAMNNEMLGLDRCIIDSDGIYGNFQRNDSACWHFHHVDTPYSIFKSNSRLRGRQIILPTNMRERALLI